MRRILRWVVFGFLFLALLGGVLLIPGVQKALFLQLAASGDRSVSVEYIHLGPGGLKVRNLEFAADGILARIPSANIGFSWTGLLRKQLRIEDFIVEDVFVRMSESGAEPEEEDPAGDEVIVPEDFQGLLGQEFPITIQRLEVDGRLAVPGGDELEFAIKGQDIAPAKTGELRFSLDPSKEAAETIPAVQLSLEIPVSEAGILTGLQLEGEIHSRMSAARGVLNLEGSVVQTDTGEDYQVHITSEELLAGGVIALKGNFEKTPKQLDLELTGRGENLDFLQPMVAEPLPPVSFVVRGQTDLEPGRGFRAGSLSFRFDADAGAFPEFGEPIRADGNLRISTGDGNRLSLDELSLSVAPPEDARAWVALQLLEPQVFQGTESLGIPQSRFAAIELFVPAQFLNSLTSEWKFSDFKGAADLAGSEGGISLRKSDPWTVSMSRNTPSAQTVELAIEPTFSYTEKKTAATAELEMTDSGKILKAVLSGETQKTNFEEISFELSLSGDLAALVPLAPASAKIPTGTIDSSWKGSVGEEIQLDGSLALKQLEMDSLESGDAELRVKNFLLSRKDQVSGSGIFAVDWTTADGSSSVSALRLTADQQKNGRWALSAEEGVFVVDPRSFATKESGKVSPTEAQKPAPQLPNPGSLGVLTDPPGLPVDIRKVDLKGRIVLPDGDRRFQVAAADLLPSQEGTFSIKVDADGSNNVVSGSLAGQMRLDSTGILSRISAKLVLTDAPLGSEAMDVHGDLTYAPRSPDDNLRLEVRASPEGPPLASLRASLADDKMHASFESDFAHWLKSPLRVLIPNVSTGRVKGEASLLPNELRVQMGIAALTPLDGFESYEVSLDGRVSSLSPLDGSATLVVTDAKDKQSDLALVAKGNMRESLTFQLTGSRLDMEAIEGFAKVWGSGATPESTQSGQDTADSGSTASWPLADLPFKIDGSFAVAELIPKDLPAFNALDGRVLADTTQATLRVSGTWIDDSSMTMEGRLAQSGQTVEGTINSKVDSLPMGKLLRDINPQETPSIEGLASLGLSFDGSAQSLADLPNWMAGTLEIQVTNGVIRSLKPEARVTRFVSAGSIAGSIIGATLKRPGVTALGQVTDLFKAIPFHELTASLERTKERKTIIDNLHFKGKYFSMQGSGTIQEGDLDQIPVTPMKMNLKLGSKPPLSEPLEVLDLLGPQVNEEGYREWKKTIEMTGTLSSPNADNLWSMVLSAVERAATMSAKDLEKERKKKGEESPDDKKSSKEEAIEQGVNRLLELLSQ